MKKIALVTGATDGIGKKTAWRLLEAGQHVIVHGRDPERVRTAVRELQDLGQKKGLDDVALASIVFDLASLAEVKRGASELLNRFPSIHVLVNNAGTYQLNRKTSVDGFELTTAINHLGPTLLTLLLKPCLINDAPSRVIFVSSIAHLRGKLDEKNYNFEQGYRAYEAYATSKLANVIVTKKLASQWRADGVSVYALHPGVISTKLLKLGFDTDGDTVENGSNTSVYLAT